MRPRAIFLLCFAVAAMTLPKFFNALYAIFVTPGLYAAVWLVSNTLVLVSCYGLWQMRRWGVYLFLAGWGLKLAGILWFPMTQGRTPWLIWFPIIVLLVYLAVVAHYWKDMDGTPQSSD